jgi:hypothetical protein
MDYFTVKGTDTSVPYRPNGIDLVGTSGDVRNGDSRRASDQSYAAWATDEINNGCTVNDDSDLNCQNAQPSDGLSTANKTSFAALWNPVASQYNVPTVTQSSF